MAKLMEKPEGLKVTVNMEGIPLTLFRNGSPERITKVYQHWHVVEQWWGEEVSKEYFTVKTSRGLVYDIYRDVLTNSWYLGHIRD